MKIRNANRKDMIYECMDATDLKFPNSFFDFIFDKSTIDAILCGDSGDLKVALMTKEAQRTLKVGSHYFIVSYGEPGIREIHFQRMHLSLEISEYKISIFQKPPPKFLN